MEQDAPGCFRGLRSLFSRSNSARNMSASRSDDGSSSATALAYSRQSPPIDAKNLKSTCACFCSYAYPTIGVDSDAWALDLAEEAGPPPYHASSAESIYRPEVMETIEKTIVSLDEELRKLSLKIHDHPEVGFREFYAHDTLTGFMRSHGFKVTPHLADITSAWRAEWSYGKGGRTLGINSEMDALPGIGHACGHNLIAVSGVAVALGTKAAMEAHQISGKIILLGTPAEEGGGGKVLLLERGAYKDMDVCVMSHPGPGLNNSVSSGRYLAVQTMTVEYFGHTAHAAYAPWEGQNALDAAVLAYNGVSMLRQQIKPDCRVHGIIEGRDWAANIIPDYAKMQWIVRTPSYTELDNLLKRVRACIDAAATATGCKTEISEGRPYYELRQNSILEQEFVTTVKERYDTRFVSRDLNASTDFGNVTYALPAIHPMYAIPTQPNGANHTPEFTRSARTPEAHVATMTVAKGLALVGVRVLDDSTFFRKVRSAFEDQKKSGAGPSNT